MAAAPANSDDAIGQRLLKRHMSDWKQQADTAATAADSSAAASASAASSLPPPFTILSFNMLANSLCDATSFPYTAPAALDWTQRRALLLAELSGTARVAAGEPPMAILTAQEIDHFSDYFAPQLKARGWDGWFVSKSAESASGGKDGVALFVRPDRFRVRRIQKYSLTGMTQVAIIAQLEPMRDAAMSSGSSSNKSSSRSLRRLYVVTTHLKAAPGFESVRLRQSQMIVHETQRFIARYHALSLQEEPPAETIDVTSEQISTPLLLPPGSFVLPPSASVLLTGDLNDIPESPMYRFLCSGVSTEDASNRGRTNALQWGLKTAVQATAPLRSFVWLRTPGIIQRALKNLGGRTVASATAPAPPIEPVTHELWLHSLYQRCFSPIASGALGHHSGPVYTIAQRRLVLSQGCIDYIFYTPSSLAPRALLSLPDVARELPDYLPCTQYPSDHLAIAGRFEWREM